MCLIYSPVQISTGTFGALQVTKAVLSKAENLSCNKEGFEKLFRKSSLVLGQLTLY